MARWQLRTTTATLGAIAFASMAATDASAQSYYAGLSAGTATFFDQGGFEYDYFGYVVAGQVGYRMSPSLRVEAELSYAASSADDNILGVNVDVDTTVIRPSVSAYYDFVGVSLGGLTPFAGAGLGIAFAEVDADIGGSVEDEELSAHLDGGANLALGSGLDLVPMARWELTDDLSNFQLRLGARFGF